MEATRARCHGMTVFPPELPAHLDQPAIISTHDWQAFRNLTYMENHWQRGGWTPGRRSYHWMLSFHQAEDIQRLAERCQTQLPPSGLDLVPLDALHVTLGRIAFTDEIPKETALAIADVAVPRCQSLVPLMLTIGPLAGSQGAIRFSVAPWSPLLTLHRELVAATHAVIGDQCVMDTSQFRPHLSIAYANAEVPIASLVPVLERLRELPPVTTVVPSVALVELRREGLKYVYDIMEELGIAM
jgi:2'-5' RNA ligase